MELPVVINGRKYLAGQLYRQLREAIESGRLAAGTQLPPSRLLAEQLGVSRKTVSDTYAQLTYDTYLTGMIGKGTFVNARPPGSVRKQHHSQLASANSVERWRTLPVFLRHPSLQGSLRYDFIGGATTKGLFPQDEWRRCTAFALRQMAGSKGFYSEPAGLPALRSAIAGHIAFSRGVVCEDTDVVVCNGAQQALDLIARVLIEPGCRVAMEDPGYPPARLLFASHGAEVVGVPVDEHGIQVELIPEGTRLIYVTPSHQFPLGLAMAQARREALLERAYALGAIIIEDDYDSEFRYEGRRLRRDLLENPAAGAAPGLRHSAAGDPRSGAAGQAVDRPAHLDPAAVGVGQVHQPRLPAAAHSSLSHGVCRTPGAHSQPGSRRLVALVRSDPQFRRVSPGADVQGQSRRASGHRFGEESRSRAVRARRFFLSPDTAQWAADGLRRDRDVGHRYRPRPPA